MKKKIIILVVVILSIILLAFTFILFTSVKKDLKMESNLTKEITELNLLIENNDNSSRFSVFIITNYNIFIF